MAPAKRSSSRIGGLCWTYAELRSRADAFASGLLAIGLEPGDRVGIWVAELRRMDHRAICHGESRSGPG